jgi:hypothetical protein
LFFVTTLILFCGWMFGALSFADDAELAAQHFREFAQLCERDGGAFWGVTLAGPMMFVEPQSRRIFANQADPEGQLSKHGDVFIGQLSMTVPIANYSLQWSGANWTMMIWPLPEDTNARRVLMMHESWHRIQSDVGLPMTGPDNAHLDTFDGRYWLRLEWRALAQALSQQGDDQRRSIEDALQFRRHRRNLFPGATRSERELEMHEGMAEYSGVMLAGMSEEQRVAYVVSHLEKKPDQYPSYTRSFAYISGPAYGLLLQQVQPGWHQSAKPDSDLGDWLRTTHQLDLSDLDESQIHAIAERYDRGELRAKEMEREHARLARQKLLRERFVDGPVLALPQRKSSFSFDPSAVEPLTGVGLFYNTAQITDEWGTLEVSNGVLKDSDGQRLRVTAPVDPSNLFAGDGWTLTLNEGWRIVAGERFGEYVVEEFDRDEE